MFVHLHVHTEFSLLDGACRIRGLMERVRSLGQTAVAITDHGVMYGVVDFFKAAQEAGVKPIIGCEVYMARRTRFDRVHEFDANPYHLVLLCENETGYRNLCHMVSRANIEGFYNRPRIDWDLLKEHHEGLICLSACLSGEIPRLIQNGQQDEAVNTAKRYAELFGKDRFYLEIQDHNIPDQKNVMRALVRMAGELDLPLAATNDAHYLSENDAGAQDILMCIQTGSKVEDEDRMRFSTNEFYIKSEEQMAALFPAEALENTAKIAEMCNFGFVFGSYHLPAFTLPEGETDSALYLRKRCEEGYKRRYPEDPEGYRQRLDYELGMIVKMGFPDYFLIVADFVNFAKSKDIPVGPGRGSGAGSMAAYCLGITDVDPMKYALFFERFLNPDRISMPDFDIDFCGVRRQEVIDYVIQKYGADHVAQIVTFGTMGAKSVLRDVARVVGLTYAEGDTLAKAVPFALQMTLNLAMEKSEALRELYENEPRYARVIDTARVLEGMPRHASTHAAGVVITSRPVSEYVPLARNDESIVTQFPMTTLEELGLLKMDFLGLRNLTILKTAETMAKRRHPHFDGQFPEDDPAVFEMLSKGQTSGVFQLESAGMTGVCTRLHPQSIEDITAVVALYRPGPMDSIPRFIDSKHHPQRTTYKHPLLEPILNVTYGCIVYQEQVLSILQQLAGFTLGHADLVRRAMSKKKFSALAGEEKAFLEGCEARGVSKDTAKSIFDEIMEFANYAFNKAHAVCYAVIAYRTAWYKKYYPAEYMAALLSGVQDNAGKIQEYITECNEQGLQVLPPDVQYSEDGFTVSEGAIRFGLGAIKNLGHGLIASLCAERDIRPFSGFDDFCRRMLSHDMNKRALESLIKCGAFDTMGYKRHALFNHSDLLMDMLTAERRRTIEGQFDLFSMNEENGAPPELPMGDVEEWSIRDKLAMERELTGLYLSGHPMDAYGEELRRGGIAVIRRLQERMEEGEDLDGEAVRLAGFLGGVRTKTTKRNDLMAYATLEDKTGSIELLLFSGVLGRSGGYVKNDRAVFIRGKISIRDERPAQVLVDEVKPLEQLSAELPAPAATELPPALYLRLPDGDGGAAKRVKAMLTMFPGKTPTTLILADTGKRLGAVCGPAPLLMEELERLLGAENIKFGGKKETT